jgi:uncharacterized protein YqhQ
MNEDVKGMPSVWRRLGVILVYVAISTLVLAIVVLVLSSSECVQYANCSDQDKLISKIASLIYWMSVAFIMLAGWTGRLYGCRNE